MSAQDGTCKAQIASNYSAVHRVNTIMAAGKPHKL